MLDGCYYWSTENDSHAYFAYCRWSSFLVSSDLWQKKANKKYLHLPQAKMSEHCWCWSWLQHRQPVHEPPWDAYWEHLYPMVWSQLEAEDLNTSVFSFSISNSCPSEFCGHLINSWISDLLILLLLLPLLLSSPPLGSVWTLVSISQMPIGLCFLLLLGPNTSHQVFH